MKKQFPFALVSRGTVIGAAALFVVGCNTEGQDPLEPRLEMSISAPQYSSDNPIPLFVQDGQVICDLTRTDTHLISVLVERSDGSGVGDLTGDEIQGSIRPVGDGQGRAFISRFPDPDEDTGEGDDDDGGDGACGPMVAVPVELTAGEAQFIISGVVPGDVQFSASGAVDDISLQASRTFTVGEPDADGGNSVVLTGPAPRRVPTGSSEPFELTVLDEAGDPLDGEYEVELSIDLANAANSDVTLDSDEGQGDTIRLPVGNEGRLSFDVVGGDLEDDANLSVRVWDDQGEELVETEFDVAIGRPDSGPQIATRSDDLPSVAPGETITPQELTINTPDTDLDWRVVEGDLPEGLELTSGGELQGTVSDDVTPGDVYEFRVRVDDQDGSSDIATLRLSIADN